MNRLIIYLCLSASLLLPVSASAIVNGEAPAKSDKRFDAVGAFSQTQWLNVTQRSKVAHNWFGSAVLIAPDVVLTARHLIPMKDGKPPRPDLYTVRFRRHADGSLGNKKAGPESYHQVKVARWVLAARYDLALAILEQPVTHIKPVKVLLKSEDLSETTCVLAGWGSESKWRGEKNPRIGLKIGENKMTTANTVYRLLSYKTETRKREDGRGGAYVIDENAVPNMHDSGGSMFVYDKDKTPLLAGIIATYTGGSWIPHAVGTGFPIEAGTQGGKALVAALKDAGESVR